VQIKNVHVSKNEKLIKVPDYKRRIEIIGDSIACGMYATYEGLSSFSYSIGAGLGDTEFSISAFTGLCVHDASCWGNPRGLTYQWFQTSDTSDRARALWNDTPEAWDFAKEGMADIVLIHAGTNDGNGANHVSRDQFLASYLSFVQSVHGVYPKAHIVLVSLWSGFYTTGVSWAQSGAWVDEIYSIYEAFKDEGWLHYFNTTGILQHNDIGPQAHPTDVGHVKVCHTLGGEGQGEVAEGLK
jgi:lysophospholipase L1-like esterase